MNGDGASDENSFDQSAMATCNNPFGLDGPPVQPNAGDWFGNSPVLCMPTRDALIGVPSGGKSKLQNIIDAAKSREASTSAADPNRKFLDSLNFDGATAAIWPQSAALQLVEAQELVFLSRLRDDASQLANIPRYATEAPDPIQGRRLPLSMFLQIRPQPPGARLNTARDFDAFPALATGRELARYFETETPGIPFRQALDYILQETALSPPLLSIVTAAVELATAAGLAAAWYFKWQDARTRCRKRPVECFTGLDVLYDRRPNSTNSGDGTRRSFPPVARPLPIKLGELDFPERFVGDLTSPAPGSQPYPGTPRHPAFPSGHSTYAAAAAYTLIGIFPNYAEQLIRLADNAGTARMFAGIHWRSDHVFGHLVGRGIAELILQQLVDANIMRPMSPGQVVYLPFGLKYLQPDVFVEPVPNAITTNPCTGKPFDLNFQGGRQGA